MGIWVHDVTYNVVLTFLFSFNLHDVHVGDLVLQIGQFSVESFDSFLDTGLE